MDKQDASGPFNDENTKPVPDKEGMWFYHATGMPVKVIRKEDGELYFQAGPNMDEEMKVSAFATMKAHHAELSKYSFSKLRIPLEGSISVNQQN